MSQSKAGKKGRERTTLGKFSKVVECTRDWQEAGWGGRGTTG